MEVQYKQASQASLPKLSVTEEHQRRDSLSSSRTGDSGYISDPEISLSPLEFVQQDNGLAIAYFQRPLPSATLEFVDVEAPKITRVPKGAYSAVLLKRIVEGQETDFVNKVKFTSNPIDFPPVQSAKRPDWTKPLNNPSKARSLDPTHFKDKSNTFRKEDVELWIDDSVPSHNTPKERVSSIVSLSSTGSADMYSVTEDSEEEEVPEFGIGILSKATLKTIELIMRKIEVNLGYAAYMQCAGGQTSRKPSGTGETFRTTGRGTGQGASGKRKSRADEGTPSENPDDDGSTKRRKVSIATTEDSEIGPRFACPFFKHDPNRYRNRRTCPGPGWPTVHRMKEHLYRAHAQPIFCPRCYTMFDSDNEFSSHLRSNPCQISVPQPIDGIDRETLTGLRKRSAALRLEEDKWRDTYRLLFPEVEGADIPSPYYDSNSPAEESRQFRRVLLERIRRELFATAEQETGPVEQNLLRQVADIIQRCENDLLSSFHPVTAQHHPQPSLSHTPQTILDPHITPNAPRSTYNPANPRPPLQAPSRGRLPPASTSGSRTNNVPFTAPSPSYPVQSPPIHFGWDDPLHTPSSEWIDWNAVFPPGPESHAERPALATPVWT